jgi:hypothetical protein
VVEFGSLSAFGTGRTETVNSIGLLQGSLSNSASLSVGLSLSLLCCKYVILSTVQDLACLNKPTADEKTKARI